MHVTSNPFFAFHDDVFPAFAKNAVFQPLFPRSPSSFFPPFPKTIIPEYEKFNDDGSSLEEIHHISTIKLGFKGNETFKLDLNYTVK